MATRWCRAVSGSRGPARSRFTVLADRDIRIAALQVAIEHVAMRRGALEQPREAMLGAGREFEVVQDAGSRARPVVAGDREAFGVGVAAAALHPYLASA